MKEDVVIISPKKIYLFKNPISETPDDRWLSKRSGDDDIEYTRTDAFVEKACKKLKQLMYDSLMYQGRLKRDEVIDNFIEDFKERIKEQ